MKNLKKNGGITLVALVITIIILLILAGISISALTNQGLFGRANDAKRESEIANIKEKIALDIYEKQLEPPLGSITEEQLETILGKYGTVNKEDGTIVGITTGKGYEILLKDIYGGETVSESVPDGAIVTPVNDITTWLKTGEISNQYSYTTIEQVIADSTCTESLMNNENAMKYLTRSTEFADAICASETAMTYLGQSEYVDDTVLNSDSWVAAIYDSAYMTQIFVPLVPYNGTTENSNSACVVTSSKYDTNGDYYNPYRIFNGQTKSWANGSTNGNYGYRTTDIPAWIQVVFNNPVSIFSTIYVPRWSDHARNQVPENTQLQYSLDEGTTWLNASDIFEDGGNYTTRTELKFKSNVNISTRYWRVYFYKVNAWCVCVDEMQFYGR